MGEKGRKKSYIDIEVPDLTLVHLLAFMPWIYGINAESIFRQYSRHLTSGYYHCLLLTLPIFFLHRHHSSVPHRTLEHRLCKFISAFGLVVGWKLLFFWEKKKEKKGRRKLTVCLICLFKWELFHQTLDVLHLRKGDRVFRVGGMTTGPNLHGEAISKLQSC